MLDEDFDIDTLAKHLHLTPDQVRRMADRGRLPGRRVGGEWKFSAAEIHHWFEDKIGISDETELIEVQRVLDRHDNPTDEFDTLAELLTVERIGLPLAARTKNSVIQQMCSLSADSGALWQPEEMAEAIKSRENLHPTALENGVALLHPRRPKPGFFGESFLSLGITSSGIPFGGPRGCLTDIFFLIASGSEAIHLKVLAKLSRLVQKPDFLEQLRSATSPEVAWQVFQDADNSI